MRDWGPFLATVVAGYGAAALWVGIIACDGPEEDGCASVGSTILYVLMVGTPVVLVLATVLALWHRLRSD